MKKPEGMKERQQKDLINGANRSQNRAECLSDAQKVKVYRKDCVGCLYANEAVCCGGVR